MEAVVIDDASTTEAALAALDSVERTPEVRAGLWQLVRLLPPGRYLGGARNEAARHAAGKFLFFLDDDNCLKPHALSTLLHVARVTSADILTVVNDKWASTQSPIAGDVVTKDSEQWLPLGPALTVGIFRNCFGDAAALVSASAFRMLGGFSEVRHH